MILDDIIRKLEQKNFHKVALNVERIHLHYVVVNRYAYIVLLVDMDSLKEFTREQYEHVINQVKSNFMNKDFDDVRLLSVIVTKQVDKAKSYCFDTDTHWIADMQHQKLLIFENQDSFFLDMRNMLEDILIPYDNATSVDTSTDSKIAYNGSTYNTKDYQSNRSNNKHPRRRYFSLCNTTIIILNVLAFLWTEINGSSLNTGYMLEKGAMFWPYVINNEEYYRLFTYMFLHFGTSHILNNMIVLAFVGDNLERAVGKVRYLFIYFGTGFIAGLASMVYNMLQDNNVVSAGASGAIFGVVGAMVYVVALNRGRLEDISTRQLVIFAFFSLYGGLTSRGIDNIAHIAGLVSGLMIAILIYRKPKKREVYRG